MANERLLIDESLRKALVGDDDLGKVIRSHLIIESRVNALLDLRVEYPKHFEEARLSYSHKIHLAAALGVMRANLLPPLRKLGKLRNDFAHKPEAKLTRPRENEVIGVLSALDRRVMKQAFTRTKSRMPDTYSGSLDKLKTPARFILAMVVLNGALFHMKLEMEKHGPGWVAANN